MVIKEVIINNTALKGYEIELPRAMLVVLRAPRGFVMCGYLNIDAADKFNDIAAIVRGIKTIDELLEKDVSAVSKAASEAGITVGMTGRQAISLML